jgi:formamidopyrimidine-DNA glycosylase
VPELPEVEVVRRRIAPLLVDREIVNVRTTRPSYFFLTAPAVLERRLAGRRATALDRIGKYLVAELDNGGRLLLHLGMTGQLFTSDAASRRLFTGRKRKARTEAGPFRPDRHTHLILEFADGEPRLVFRDARKFGKVAYLEPGVEEPRLTKLGPDALAAAGRVLFEATRSRRVSIKSLLLDQSVLAGVGNIYADEALYLARVRPTRRAERVTRAECVAIARAVRQVLRRSIAAGGSSISDYVQPDGSDGSYQERRHVYARTGEACRRCKQRIVRVVIGQRSSHFCPSCQR